MLKSLDTRIDFEIIFGEQVSHILMVNFFFEKNTCIGTNTLMPMTIKK
jgi:hypothetical protein